MKLAFYLFKYFPFGGLQRDFVRIATECQQRGHEIHVYSMLWQGEKPKHFNVHLLKTRGLQNHTRSVSFVRQVQKYLPQYDLNIGFNKMPGLDVYYAADVCYAARIMRQKSKFYRLLPRYREWQRLEQSVFNPASATEILLIAEKEQQEFARYYGTQPERFHLLPPGIQKNRIAGEHVPQIRAQLREKEQWSSQDRIILMVGSGFKTKGVDRAIIAFAALPQALRQKAHLVIIGQDDARPFQKLAQTLKVQDRIRFLGGRGDVADFLFAADLLLHPAYHENTGTVLLEALVAGLPVLTVAGCGYASHIYKAQAGEVLPEPFAQQALNTTLQKMLSSDNVQYRHNALSYARSADLFSMPEKAVDIVELIGNRRGYLSAS